MLKIGVLLSGCGVYDGAEIQETVLSLLAIDQLGAQAVCIGIDADQHHDNRKKEHRDMLTHDIFSWFMDLCG